MNRMTRLSAVLALATALFLPVAVLVPATRADAPSGLTPFAGQLTEVEGVQAIVSLKHPQLVNQDLGKMMTAVPEAAMLRMVLSSLSAYGYPDFADIAPGSNLGVAVVTVDAADLRTRSAVVVGFAKLQAGGKLWTVLQQHDLVLQKHGDWTLIGADSAAIAKLKSPDAVIAYLEKPQDQDLRVWVRTSPAFVATIKDAVVPVLQPRLAGFPADKQKAALAYLDAVQSLVQQLHSVEFSIAFENEGLKLAYAFQFLPDSPAGILFRSPAGPLPVVARSISADALATWWGRSNPKALGDFINSVFNTLLAVDYPPAAERLKKLQATYAAIMAGADGGSAGAFDLTAVAGGGPGKTKARFLIVQSGAVAPQVVHDYFRQSQLFNDPLPILLRPSLQRAGFGPMSRHSVLVSGAATVDGISFDSLTVTSSLNGTEISRVTQYCGDVDGSIVVADSPATLEKYLPALRARKALPDGIAVPDHPDEFQHFSLNGGKLVDLVAAVAKADLTNAEVALQIKDLKAGFAAAPPLTLTTTIGQARVTMTLAAPYKFIEAGVHFGVYVSSQRLNLINLVNPAAAIANSQAGALPSQTWPGQQPAFTVWRNRFAQGREYAATGRLAEALTDYLWCLDHGLVRTAGTHPVPINVLTTIAKLGATYPPALQALRDRRDQAVTWAKSHPEDRTALTNLLAFNRVLKDDASTLAFYDALPAGNPGRTLLLPMLYPQFIAAGRYGDALQVKSYEQYQKSFAGYQRVLQSAPGFGVRRLQLPYMVNLAGSEAQALAGTGDLVHARQVVADLLQLDHSPRTLQTLRDHLSRVGHGELVTEEVAKLPPPAPAAPAQP